MSTKTVRPLEIHDKPDSSNASGVRFASYEVLDADTRKRVLSLSATSVDVVRAAVIRGDVTRAMAPSGYVIVRDVAAGQAVAFLEVSQ